ncbi:Zinc finger protein dpff-1 [Caenorhabditis elegans]|uniref:Isoform c of Zinc finger protein dpff-1 n=1 Tax=Caenorhabditis elegans TaxID=6239 RepID=Q09477-3|nr:Zinc finger protein dpff-1 [Caenorhabditis elegans]CCD65978.1 Zinc finger protein dpff-1 [Caenorhabditis elegans]|eukprot:NP_001122678.1 Zinc finger protein dpff-1 [Caenorhabditis elegans]
MISENGYMDLMRNCIKWNSRQMEDRKKRLRFPYYEHQTATAQRESRFTTRNVDHMYPSNDPNTVVQFATERWKKSKSQPPSDAVEMSMFLRENPSIQVAIDHLTPQVVGPTTVRFAESVSDSSNDSTTIRPSRQTQIKEEYRDDYVLDDELSPDEFGSDEDDWSSRKRRKGNLGPVQKATSSRKKNAARNTKASRV